MLTTTLAKNRSATGSAPTEKPNASTWESKIAELLSGLSEAQGELLEVLAEKREALMTSNTEGLAAIQAREQALIDRLQACQQQRSELLGQAEQEGLPAVSIVELASALEKETDEDATAERASLAPQLADAQARSRILHHQALTNWVLVQRTLLHLSQLLEVIATGGRPNPTYGKDCHATTSGSLVDHAV